ncbi:DUF6318 family protein [Cellulomonas sp. 179-A 9B4 NHS]|uniref:DUF6318 family protein n=1 Tax=Cellulomonas sp. 179-A 9B4 NHS TaxID=3142379 RepID=UPI0039A1DB04
MTATVLVGLVAAGCTGDATPTGPTAAETRSSTATPTPSASLPAQPVFPTLPADAGAPSVQGAAAFAMHAMRLYTYTRNTADVSEWQALSGPECGFCGAVEEMVGVVGASGRTLRGADVEVHSTSPTEISPGSTYSVTMEVTESESIEYDGDQPVARNPSTRSTLYVLLQWDQAWHVLEVDVLESETVA